MPFSVIFAVFRALWLVPSMATGAPLPFCHIQMGRSGACAHVEVKCHVLYFLYNQYIQCFK